MRRFFILSLLLVSGLSLSAQDFMLQGWYWDYDKDGCNGYAGPNWTTQLNGGVADLANAGFTYVWLPPLSRASFGACSNGYDPKDLYDLGEFGLGRTGFGTRAEVDALIANLNANGMEAVADVVYNHRDGGDPEDNPAVKDYMEIHFNGGGKQPFPSDRYRLRLPLGGTYGAGEYYIKVSSKTQSYGPNQYKFYPTVESRNNPFLGTVNENEPNGGGDCGQPFNDVILDQDMVATLYDFSGCYTDEFRLTLTAADFDAAGDNLLIFMNNILTATEGYSDHRVYDIFYAPASGAPGFNVDLNDLQFQTFTDFTNLPSGQGGKNFENFRPNSANTSTTFLAGDFDSPLFFYDVVQSEPSTRTVYSDWSEWLINDVGVGGLRMDAVKHFPPSFVAQVLDDLAGQGINPGMVVGEFFDGNATLLKDWVDAVDANITASSSLVRVFDFSLRNALKEACDNVSFDRRNVFNASLWDNGLSGFNVVTFVNNHDFRGPGEPVQSDPMLAYAYILTNNQIGVPTVFYPDFFGTSIPEAPTVNLSAEIGQLMQIHHDHIFGSSAIEYLNRFSTPYAANYQSGGAGDALIYQISGGAGAPEVVVAINYGNATLKVDQQLNLPGGSQNLAFTDLTGNAFNATTSPDGSNRILIDVPARSYAVYAATSVLPVTLAEFAADAGAKGVVELNWSTELEEDVRHFVPEYSHDGQSFTPLTPVRANNAPSPYTLEHDTHWPTDTRYYRLRTVDLDGSEALSRVRIVRYAEEVAWTVAPNPAHQQVLVTGGAEPEHWALLDATGRRIPLAYQQVSGGIALDVSRLSAGVYWLRIDGQNQKVVVIN